MATADPRETGELLDSVTATANTLTGRVIETATGAVKTVSATELVTDSPAAVLATGSNVGLVLGGSGIPLPDFNIPGYVDLVDQLYIRPNFPDTTYPAPYADGLFTPEYAIGSLPFTINYPYDTSGPLAGYPSLYTSVGQGILILENAIASNLAAGNASTVLGYSQSALISGHVMERLNPTGGPMPDAGLQFVLIGNPNAPNGGFLQRFVGLDVPSFGISFNGATPDNLFRTVMYTIEYDGYAHFPKYPLNFISTLNAALGFQTMHGLYINPGVITAEVLDQAILLPGSMSLGADTLTDYYMIPSSALPSPYSYLPLVQPLLSIPVIGQPLADLVQPVLKVLVDLGYGPDYYSQSANVPTPFGVFPDVDPATVFSDLVIAGQQGINAFLSDLQDLSFSAPAPAASVSTLPSQQDLLTALATAATDPGATLTRIVDAITNAATSLYSALLPVAGIINAAVTTIPAYSVTLFLNNLSNPVNAIGLPIAANVGAYTVGGFLAISILAQGLSNAIYFLSTIFVPPPPAAVTIAEATNPVVTV